jgi:hypothetical protein
MRARVFTNKLAPALYALLADITAYQLVSHFNSFILAMLSIAAANLMTLFGG